LYFSSNKTKFDSLKKILLITSIILSITINSNGQKSGPGDGNGSVVRFYPNPATNFITFDFNNNDGYNLQIFNFLGRKMNETNVSSKTIINLSDFTRGMYVYQLRDRSGKMIESGKFQVSK